METIHVNIERHNSTFPPEDYYKYYYRIPAKPSFLTPRIGIDMIFLIKQPNIKSLIKKLDRFWATLRKSKGKEDFIKIKNRTYLVLVNNSAEAEAWIVLSKKFDENLCAKWSFQDYKL